MERGREINKLTNVTYANCPLGFPWLKPYKTWARDLTACSCYKKPFFGKNNKEKNQPIPPRCHHLFLVIFRGRSGRGCHGNRCELVSVKKGPWYFFSLSFFQLCMCVHAAHACAHTRNFFFRTKESPSLPSVPQIWSDGKPLTPAGQGRFRMVQEKRERSYGAPFLYLLARDCMQQRPSQVVGVPRAGKKGRC